MTGITNISSVGKILAENKWNIQPQWKAADGGFEPSISGTTAGVVIGDRAFKLNQTKLKRWDLPEEWKEMTGLPFVFVAWVATPLEAQFTSAFSAGLEFGLKHKAEAMKTYLSSSEEFQHKLTT